MSLRFTILIFLLFTQLSCSPDGAEQTTPLSSTDVAVISPSATEAAEYIAVDDLPGLLKRGVVRLLAPTFDRDPALVRDGMPVLAYQQLAEKFLASLSLRAQWVYVDEFDQLLPSLNEGKGDLIVTNMSITKQRQTLASFSVPLTEIDELLVTTTQHRVTSIEQIGSLSVAVPEGTAYVETLNALKEDYPELEIQIVPSHNSDIDMLEGVTAGKFQATVLDSNIAKQLLRTSDNIHADVVLKQHRKISWALRSNNPLLRQKLDEFFFAEHIRESRKDIAFRDWTEIKKTKSLRLLTLNNPASYFMWRGELLGFDYDLIKRFANENDLRLVVIVKDDIESLFAALQAGEGDIIAASITTTEERKAQGLSFSKRYLSVTEQLVGKMTGSEQSHSELASVDQLEGKTIVVNPQTTFYARLKAIEESGIKINIKQQAGATTEELIASVIAGEYDYTLADSHLVAIEKTYREDLWVAMEFGDKRDIAFVLRPNQSELMDTINHYVTNNYRGLFFNVTYNKYFKNKRKMSQYRKSRVIAGSDLSPYDSLVKRESISHKVDWRLITAQMYQESKFDPDAHSFAGAQGLMQVLPRTAKEFGYNNLYQPENSIGAGVAYIYWLRDRFPGELSLDQRTYFTLAAYNAGTGHVRDARRLAKQMGMDPTQWFGNVENAMLLLAKPEYAKKARFGYVRGSEPVSYVRSIRDRYLGYLETHDN